jgi:DNA-directed RNA polymerase subunit L
MPARATVSGIEEATTIANALTNVLLKDESVLL